MTPETALPARRLGVGRWLILRTSGARTIPLADSLDAAGIDVWTPRRVHLRRAPRSKSTVERAMPIAPTFAFAAAGDLPGLSAILAMPVSPHPPFSIFRHGGRIPLIADSEIEPLRREEERERICASRTRRRGLVMGQRVRFDQGAIAGLTGIVQDQQGDYALVAFDGAMTIKIASWLLPDEGVEDRQPFPGATA